MNQVLPEDEDARLKVLFAAAAKPVADAGFSEYVLERVERNARKRRLVLGTAGAIGFAVAAEPLWHLAELAGRTLSVPPEGYALLGAWLGNPWLWGAAAALLALMPALRVLEE